MGPGSHRGEVTGTQASREPGGIHRHTFARACIGSHCLGTESGRRQTSLPALSSRLLTQRVHGAREAAVLADAQEGRNHLLHQLLQLQIALAGACGLMNTLRTNIQDGQRSAKVGTATGPPTTPKAVIPAGSILVARTQEPRPEAPVTCHGASPAGPTSAVWWDGPHPSSRAEDWPQP